MQHGTVDLEVLRNYGFIYMYNSILHKVVCVWVGWLVGGGGGDFPCAPHRKETVVWYRILNRDFPQYGAYTVLDFFASDWLNEVWYWRHDVSDDYQFVYMGPKGTWYACIHVIMYITRTDTWGA